MLKDLLLFVALLTARVWSVRWYKYHGTVCNHSEQRLGCAEMKVYGAKLISMISGLFGNIRGKGHMDIHFPTNRIKFLPIVMNHRIKFQCPFHILIPMERNK